MIPLRVVARNYGPYPDVEWDIPNGLTVIVGENDGGEGISSNGAGKTKLLELVPLALFGPTLPWSEYLTLGCDLPCVIECEFEHAGEQYRVRRIYSPAGRGQTSLDFDQFYVGPERGGEADEWEPLTQESQLQTQALIERIIGMSETTFGHSVFAAQGARHFADPSLAPRDRKAILSEALGLDIWERMLEHVRRDKNEIERDLNVIELRLQDWEPELALREELEVEHERLRVDVEQAKKRRADALQHSTLVRGQRDLVDKRDRLQDLLAGAENAARSLTEMELRNESLQPLVDSIPELEATLRRLSSYAPLRSELMLQNGAFSILVRQRDGVIDTMVCDRCGQEIQTEAAKKRATGQLDAEISAVETKIASLQDQLPPDDEPEPSISDLNEMLNRAKVAQQELLSNTGRAESLTRTVVEAEPIPAMLAEVVDQLVGLDARGTSDLGAGEVELEEAGEMVDATQLALGTSAGRLERLADLHVEATAARERRTLLVARLEVLATLERAYGRDGIPALILESSAIPHIEAEAARVLWELGTPFRIQLQTQRETKSGTLKDTLDVIVHEPNGSRRYETYSGGERTRLELALRIGLARLLAHRADVQIGLLALDEPAFLDAAGIYQLAIVLVGLLDEFASIVLISHDEKLTDVFNQVVLVRRERGVSRIVNEGTADA